MVTLTSPARPARSCASASASSPCSRSLARRAGCGCATRASSPSATSRSPASRRPTASGSRAALESAALEMTTLHVREEALREATATFTSVEDLRVRTDFPHGMTIEVIERQPVAALARGRGERRIPVTGVRRPAARRDRRARPSEPRAARRPAVGPRLTDRRALRALTIASAAPDPLLRRADELEIGSRGVVVALEERPRTGVRFRRGRAREVDRAAARVLAETSAAGRDLSRPPDSRSGGRWRARAGHAGGGEPEPST